MCIRDSSIGLTYKASILDDTSLDAAMSQSDVAVHIAAWHGVHEATKTRTRKEFWNLNVTGTFEVYESARRNGVQKIILISSSAAIKGQTFYGQTKALSEQIAKLYAYKYGVRTIALQARAFVPETNSCLLYTSPSPRDATLSRMPSSA